MKRWIELKSSSHKGSCTSSSSIVLLNYQDTLAVKYEIHGSRKPGITCTHNYSIIFIHINLNVLIVILTDKSIME